MATVTSVIAFVRFNDVGDRSGTGCMIVDTPAGPPIRGPKYPIEFTGIALDRADSLTGLTFLEITRPSSGDTRTGLATGLNPPPRVCPTSRGLHATMLVSFRDDDMTLSGMAGGRHAGRRRRRRPERRRPQGVGRCADLRAAPSRDGPHAILTHAGGTLQIARIDAEAMVKDDVPFRSRLPP